MCGFAGFIDPKCVTLDPSHVLKNMLQKIKNRGPDSFGVWNNNEIYLGHNRLAIVDLTSAGHQPMLSKSGRYVMVYNGEIYNTEDLRKEFISSYQWRGRSDTEVILAIIERDGLEKSLSKLVGIFALVIFDNLTKEIHLVRDHIGVKPLYYGIFDEIILFGSQIKCFLPHPVFKKELCSNAMAMYFKYNYIPAPNAIYKNCYKVEPGKIITFKDGKIIAQKNYWSMYNAALTGREHILQDVQEITNCLQTSLYNAVKSQMEADVPVGIFLSGGIDSSLIASLAQSNSIKPVKTFSIGFEEPEYNEAHHALKIAKHLRTEHIEEYLSINKALDLITEIPEYCDEPFGDASQIPTLLVSKLARKHVTVVLSGDGGDEFYAGYNRYFDILKFQKLASYLPTVLKNFCAKTVEHLPQQIKRCISPQKLFKIQMAARCLSHYSSVDNIYNCLFDFWPGVLEGIDPMVVPIELRSKLSNLAYMQYHDSVHYLPDDILTKVDRCSMQVSLETRVPFLDHRLIEFSWKIPDHMKFQNGSSKWILRQILYKFVPKNLIDRPKQGFGVPIDTWLRGPLKEWAMSLLSDLKNDGIIPFEPINKCMDEHQKGSANWQYPLWGALMWQHWKNYYL